MTLRRRFTSLGVKSSLKVISIGNIHSGGSGKTPVVLECAKHFAAKNPAILSRGYLAQASDEGAAVIKTEPRGPQKFGDEPWMMAKRLETPVYIGKNRVRMLKQIETQGRSPLVILDDGFQHLAVARDVDVVVINVENDPLESFCLPLGDLREPLTALGSASAVLLMSGPELHGLERWETLLHQHFHQIPRFNAQRRIEGIFADGARVEPQVTFLGFAGIARPERFERDASQSATVRGFSRFRDHHSYTSQDVDRLIAEKDRLGAQSFLTTEKDFHKVSPIFSKRNQSLYSLRIGYDIPAKFWYFLEQQLR